MIILVADNLDRNSIISLILEFKSGIFLILINLNFDCILQCRKWFLKNPCILALLRYTDSEFLGPSYLHVSKISA